MRTAPAIALALGAALPLLAGCSVAPAPTPSERDFGVAHRLAIYGQTAYPGAEQNLAPVEGIDGKIALGTMRLYRQGYGYSGGMASDTTVFDLRPQQPGVSEIRVKSESNDNANINLNVSEGPK